MTSEEIFLKLKAAGITINSVYLDDNGNVRVDYPSTVTQAIRNQAATIIGNMNIPKKKHEPQDIETIKIALKNLSSTDLQTLQNAVILDLIAKQLQQQPDYAQRLGIQIRGDK
jgi:uncharacterized protein with beta-barrel porin domain